MPDAPACGRRAGIVVPDGLDVGELKALKRLDAAPSFTLSRYTTTTLERFYQRAENLPGVRFIRSYVSMGKEIPESKNVTIRYSTLDDGVEEIDLVVLSVGLNPPDDVKGLAETFGIELNPHGFCKTNPVNPIETSRPGVFVSGAFQGPIDIPESVVTASGADALCSQLLAYRRGKLATEREYPPEKDVSGEEPRVGVFVCHCGANIGRVVNVPSVVEYASSLPNVVHAQESLFACSTDNAQQISDTIREKGLNRVVVAACTPRTHEPLFRDTLREGGNQPVFLRNGQYPGALLLGPLQGKGSGHPEGQGYRPHVGGPDRPPGAVAGIRAAGRQEGVWWSAAASPA